MLQHQPAKLFALEGAVLRFAGFTIRVFKSDPTVLHRNDCVFTDHPPIQIAGQVFQCGLTSADMSTVNHPFLRNANRDRETGLIKGIQAAFPKHLSQSKLIKEIVAFELLPLSPTLIDSSAWDNNMAMRMIIQASGMGMKNRCHTDVGSQISRIEAKVFQGTGSTIE